MAKNGRLHLRLTKELEARIHDYVERHNTTLSAVASTLFLQLLEAEEAARNATAYEAEQV